MGIVGFEGKEGRDATIKEWTEAMNDISLKVAHYRAVIDENFQDLVKDSALEKPEFSSFHVAELIDKYQRGDPYETAQSRLEKAESLRKAEAEKLKSMQRSVVADTEENPFKIDLRAMKTSTSIPSIEALMSSFSEQNSRLDEELETLRKLGTATLIECYNNEKEDDEILPYSSFGSQHSEEIYKISQHSIEDGLPSNASSSRGVGTASLRKAFTYVRFANRFKKKQQQN